MLSSSLIRTDRHQGTERPPRRPPAPASAAGSPVRRRPRAPAGPGQRYRGRSRGSAAGRPRRRLHVRPVPRRGRPHSPRAARPSTARRGGTLPAESDRTAAAARVSPSAGGSTSGPPTPAGVARETEPVPEPVTSAAAASAPAWASWLAALPLPSSRWAACGALRSPRPARRPRSAPPTAPAPPPGGGGAGTNVRPCRAPEGAGSGARAARRPYPAARCRGAGPGGFSARGPLPSPAGCRGRAVLTGGEGRPWQRGRRARRGRGPRSGARRRQRPGRPRLRRGAAPRRRCRASPPSWPLPRCPGSGTGRAGGGTWGAGGPGREGVGRRCPCSGGRDPCQAGAARARSRPRWLAGVGQGRHPRQWSYRESAPQIRDFPLYPPPFPLFSVYLNTKLLPLPLFWALREVRNRPAGSVRARWRRICPLTLRDEAQGEGSGTGLSGSQRRPAEGRCGIRRSRQSPQQGQAGRGRAARGAAPAHLRPCLAALLSRGVATRAAFA